MGHDTVLWAREPEVVAAVNEKHENTAFLKVRCIDSHPPIRSSLPCSDDCA